MPTSELETRREVLAGLAGRLRGRVLGPADDGYQAARRARRGRPGDGRGPGQRHGLAVPGGRVSTTGIAGLTLGGGQGWLSGRHGLSCDNLVAAELVGADGRLLVADDRSPELLWALRGGGGNFGVVTSFTFRLHPVGPVVLGGLLLHPLARAAELAARLADLEAAFPDQVAGALTFQAAPPAPFVPPSAVGRPAVGLAAAFIGADLDAGAAALRPLREVGPPLADTVAPLPYAALQAMMDAANPPGRRHWWSAAYFPAVPAGLVQALSAAIAAAPSPYALLVLVPMGRAVNRVPEDATAFPHRASRWSLHLVAAWEHPEDDRANRAWVRATAAAVRPYASPGTYLNANAASADADRVRATYGEATYARLAAVKAALDPANVFRHTANVRPASTTEGDRCPPPR
jgi:FAD/FMN-containing dehydrogenase